MSNLRYYHDQNKYTKAFPRDRKKWQANRKSRPKNDPIIWPQVASTQASIDFSEDCYKTTFLIVNRLTILNTAVAT